MIDFHCHLDLYTNPMQIFSEVNKRRTKVLVVTTSPKAYIKTLQHFGGSDNVVVALGFHPELVQQRSSETSLFFEQMRSAQFIGEIGVDGSKRASKSLVDQVEFFREVVRVAATSGGKILSIHSRGAVKEVLQVIESNKGEYVPVLHWFTGTPIDVKKAINLGCWFSVNPNMCLTNSGKKVINCIPLNRMLPETDAPFTQINGKPYMPWDTTVAAYLAKERSIGLDDIDRLLQSNLQQIMKTIEIPIIAEK